MPPTEFFQPPTPGPFTDVLTKPGYQDAHSKVTGWGGPTETIGVLASKFLEGMAGGRLARFQKEQNDQIQKTQKYISWGNSVMQNPDIPDDVRAQFQQDFQGALAHEVHGQLKQADKGNPLTKMLQSSLDGLTGGALQGVKTDPAALDNIMSKYADLHTDPRYSKKAQFTSALNQLPSIADALSKKLGRAPTQEELQRNIPPALLNTIRSNAPNNATFDDVMKPILGAFQPGPKLGTPEADRFAAENELTTGNPPPPSPPPAATGAATPTAAAPAAQDIVTTPPPPAYGPLKDGYATGVPNAHVPAGSEDSYEQWVKAQSSKVGRDISLDTEDYDLPGLFKSGGGFEANGHAPDTFKKPNHPTFSTDSIHSGKDGKVGGQWKQGEDSKWTFYASPSNLEGRTPQQLQQYFAEREPDAKLVLPPTSSKPISPAQLKMLHIDKLISPLPTVYDHDGKPEPLISVGPNAYGVKPGYYDNDMKPVGGVIKPWKEPAERAKANEQQDFVDDPDHPNSTKKVLMITNRETGVKTIGRWPNGTPVYKGDSSELASTKEAITAKRYILQYGRDYSMEIDRLHKEQASRKAAIDRSLDENQKPLPDAIKAQKKAEVDDDIMRRGDEAKDRAASLASMAAANAGLPDYRIFADDKGVQAISTGPVPPAVNELRSLRAPKTAPKAK